MENLEAKARELQREYMRKWRAKNKDKLSKINKNYWLNKAKKSLK